MLLSTHYSCLAPGKKCSINKASLWERQGVVLPKLTPDSYCSARMRLKFPLEKLWSLTRYQRISMNFTVDIHETEGRDKVPSCLSIPSFEPPSMATGVTRPPSHFSTSLYQLRTRLEGETTMALSISGLESGLWRSSVHMRVIHCKVFPRPISSAMMQPYDPEMRLPVTHSHRNFTPSKI